MADLYPHYDDLLTYIPKFLNKRSLDGMAPLFLALAEADIQSKLRTREMQVTVEAPVTCASVNLPLDWLDATRLWIGGQPQALKFSTPDEMIELQARYGSAPGIPTHYGFIDNVITLAPVPSGECSLWMTYYAKIPRLTVDLQSNWLAVRDMGVYLYGSLVRASPYLIDDARVATWDREYTGRIQAMNTASQVALHSGGPLVRRFRGYRRGPSPIPWAGHPL
jgi:hypothetical protein